MSSDEVAQDFFPLVLKSSKDGDCSACLGSLFHCFIVQAVKKLLCDKQSGLLISVYACCLPFSYSTPLWRAGFIFSIPPCKYQELLSGFTKTVSSPDQKSLDPSVCPHEACIPGLTTLVVIFWNWLSISVSCVLEEVLARERGCGYGAPVPAAPGAAGCPCYQDTAGFWSAHPCTHPRPVPWELLPSHYCCRTYSSPGRRGFHFSLFSFIRLLSALSFSLPWFPGMAALLPSALMAPTVLEWAACQLMEVSSDTSSRSLKNWVTINHNRSQDRDLHLTSLLAESNPLTQPSEPNQPGKFCTWTGCNILTWIQEYCGRCFAGLTEVKRAHLFPCLAFYFRSICIVSVF